MAASRALHALLPDASNTINASNNSNSNMPEVSLGTLQSSFHSPPPSPNHLQGFRRPSTISLAPSRLTSSSTADSSDPALLTPSLPQRRGSRVNGDVSKSTDDTPVPFPRRRDDMDDDDVTGSPERRASGPWDDATPGPSRPKRSMRASQGGKTKGVNLTLREQEKVIDEVKNENFDLKLKIHFLEERLREMAPDQIDQALKQNINLKVEVQSRGMEIKKYKKIILELEKTVDKQQQKAGDRDRDRERRLEDELRDAKEAAKELKEQLRRKVPAAGAGTDEQLAKKHAEMTARNVELEEALEEAKLALEDDAKEMERLRMQSEVSLGKGRSDRAREALEKKVAELEAENARLAREVEAHEAELDRMEGEKDDLEDQLQKVSLENEELERRREAERADRSASRAEVEVGQEQLQAMEDDLNNLRDNLAATQIKLEEREKDVEEMEQELAARNDEAADEVERVTQNWRDELDAAKSQMEDMQNVLDERETENAGLRDRVAELEAMQADLQDKVEEAMKHIDDEKEEREAELAEANDEIQRFGERVFELEEEIEAKARRCAELEAELENGDRAQREAKEMHDQVLAALKERLALQKSELDQVKDLYESARQTLLEAQARVEELEAQIADLDADVGDEREGRKQAEAERDEAEDRLAREEDERKGEAERWERERREDEEHWQRVITDKELVAERLKSELTEAQTRLAQRETDVDALQAALNESRKQGESSSSDRFSLQLEMDRLRRDLSRCEDDLERARRELDKREETIRERETVIGGLHSDNRDISSQLAAQTQARLNLSDKLDIVQQSLKTAESELATFRSRVQDLEQRLSKDQRSLLSNEQQFRDQLTERNTLLLTVYQYMDEILGVDKTPRKGALSEAKPFTNFSAFHDVLIRRLKAVSQIQLDFDKRAKEVEARFTERLGDLKKQLDNRLRQLDRFEGSVKAAVEAKQQWRRKFAAKEGELEAAKAAHTELSNQLNALKRAPAAESVTELRSVTARANNAERRLANTQNQLAATEERLANANDQIADVNARWAARVKEWEERDKYNVERWKQERQGGKERARELEEEKRALIERYEHEKQRAGRIKAASDAIPVASPVHR